MISLCITTYNRTTLLYESFAQVLNDDRISEIVIVDDHSDNGIWNAIWGKLAEFNKVKLYCNDKNLGCYHNKKRAVELASNKWVILFDSDNIITPQYLDALWNSPTDGFHKKLILQPCFAKPHFDFTKYEGIEITNGFLDPRKAAGLFANDSTFTTALNAMNYFVNRDEYLRVWEDRPEPWTADSLLQNYNWLKAGNSIYFCPGLEYTHRIDGYGKDEGSHYKSNHRKTGNLYEELVMKLKSMR